MKNYFKAMMLIAFTSFGAWALTTGTAVGQTKKADNKDDKKQAVRDLYLRNCARCHDADGKSQSPLGQSLGAPDLTGNEVQKMSRKSIVKVITNGEEEMPAFGKKISKTDIKALAEYVRSF